MNGGLEGLTGGSNITGTTSSISVWWVHTNSNPIITVNTGAGARTGNTYINALQTSAASAKRIHSLVTTSSIPAADYTVEFNYYGDKDGAPDATQTMSGAFFHGVETKFQSCLNTNTARWTKTTFTSSITVASPAIFNAVIRINNG